MLMLSRIRDYLSHLGLCNFISKDAAYSFAFGVHLQHNPSCFGSVHSEEALQDVDHELHWSVVVIDQNYLIERWTLKFGRRFLDHQTRSIPAAFNITHELSVYRARLGALQEFPVAKRCHFTLTSKNKCLSAPAGSPYDCPSRQFSRPRHCRWRDTPSQGARWSNARHRHK